LRGYLVIQIARERKCFSAPLIVAAKPAFDLLP
jgi:hypothetical protein